MLKKITFFTLAAMLLAVSAAFAQGTVSISGRVADAESGKFMAGVVVTVGGSEEFFILNAEEGFFIEAKAGDTVRFLCDGYTTATHVVMKRAFYDMGDIRLKKSVGKKKGDTAPAEMMRIAEGRLAIKGRVVDDDRGWLLSDVAVTVGGTGKECVTGRRGLFFIEAKAGDTLRFSLPGYTTATHAISKEGKHDIGDVRLKAAGSDDEDDRPKSRSILSAQGSATVTGRVISAYGKHPLLGVGVTVYQTEETGDSLHVFRSDHIQQVGTDAAGRFSIWARAGDTIRFTFPGYKTATHTVSKSGNHDTGDIELNGECADRGQAVVSFCVTDADSGKPLPYFFFHIGETIYHANLDSTGRFAIEAAVGDTIVFTFPGYKTATHTISKAGKYHIGNVKLEATRAAMGTATVTGRVINAYDGAPIEYAVVYVSDRENAVVADNAGRFAMEVPVGDTVKFTFPGYKPVTHIVSKRGSDYLGDVELEKKTGAPAAAVVTGRVVDADSGKPIAHVFAYIPYGYREAFTDSAGRFAIKAKVGNTLKFTFPGYKETTYTVSKAGDHDIGDVRLKKTTVE